MNNSIYKFLILQQRIMEPDEVDKHIVQDPNINDGEPLIRGTRLPVRVLLQKLSDGASEEDLYNAYPKLQSEDIQAALEYAAESDAFDDLSDEQQQ